LLEFPRSPSTAPVQNVVVEADNKFGESIEQTATNNRRSEGFFIVKRLWLFLYPLGGCYQPHSGVA